jgi:choline dehydrogenase-like flavoprotein
VCIIGSGAAGITIAREFLQESVSVLVLEAGGGLFEQPSQDPYQSALAGLPHGGIHQGRVRVLGGSTTLWAGQALPLFDIDFAERDWVPYSGWPITRATLHPFYSRAEEVMQIPHVTNDEQTWPSSKALPPAYDAEKLVSYYSQFTAVPNFSHKYREALEKSANVRLLLHANVTALMSNASANRLDEVRAQSLDGHAVTIRARYIVICCGGIESARLLLVSDAVEKTGVGNRHDVVGRFFQDHPGVALPIKPLNRTKFKAWYDSVRRNQIRYSVKIAASEQFQRTNRVLHVGSEIYYPTSEEDPVKAAKELLKGARMGSIGKVSSAISMIARRPHKVLGAAFRHYVQGQPASVGSGPPHLGVGGEQQPNPSSRVMLDEARDLLGLRRSKLDWRMSAEDSRSIFAFVSTLASEWKRLGIAKLDPEAVPILGRETGAHGGYVDSNHHMGTTRMGNDPASSVVDSNCRVHGYENLYIGSSSVFPTGGFSNPTLTVIALCLRIADELKLNLMARHN